MPQIPATRIAMLSFEKAKKLLNGGERKYTDQEIQSIKKVVENLVEIEFINVTRKMNEKSNTIHKGIN